MEFGCVSIQELVEQESIFAELEVVAAAFKGL